jgi:hypothetical protein
LISDGNRSVLISPVQHPGRKKKMPGNLVEELENLQVVNPPPTDFLDEAAPVTGVSVVA